MFTPTTKKIFVGILIGIFLLLNFYHYHFLGADSWLYLRLTQNLRDTNTFGDSQTSSGQPVDSLRDFPDGTLSSFDYFSYVFYLFSYFLPTISLVKSAMLFTYLLTILNGFLVGSIIWIITKDK